MRVDMSGERELRGEPLRAAVHHADEGLLAHVRGDVTGEPGEGGGPGGEDLTSHPQTLELLLGLLGRYVNTLREERIKFLNTEITDQTYRQMIQEMFHSQLDSTTFPLTSDQLLLSRTFLLFIVLQLKIFLKIVVVAVKFFLLNFARFFVLKVRELQMFLVVECTVEFLFHLAV